MRLRIFALAAILMAAIPAQADIVYDNITGNSNQSSFYTEDEMADDIVLAAPGILSSIDVAVRRSFALPGTYNGTMTVRLYAAGNSPVALLGTSSVALALSDDLVHVVTAPFAPLNLPIDQYWASVQFSLQGNQVGAGFLDGNHPTIGSSSAARARNQGGAWNVYFLPIADFEIRVNTIPTPGAAAVLPGLLVLARRRRASPSASEPPRESPAVPS